MASFPLKNTHFSMPLHSTPNLKMFSSHQMAEILHMTNFSCRKFSPATFPLVRVHPLQTDRQTTTMLIARLYYKYGRLKWRLHRLMYITVVRALLCSIVALETRSLWLVGTHRRVFPGLVSASPAIASVLYSAGLFLSWVPTPPLSKLSQFFPCFVFQSIVCYSLWRAHTCIRYWAELLL